MEKIDKKDRILLYELSKNCRQSYGVLAKKASISKQMAHYRIKRLIRLKVLRDTILTVDVGKLGYQNYVVYFQWGNRQLEKEFINEILNHHSVRYAAGGSGKINFVVTFNAKNPMEFQKMWDDILSKYEGVIRVCSIQVITEYHGFESSSIIGKQNTENTGPYLISGETRVRIDDYDKKILMVLTEDARASLLSIASSTVLSPDTVKNRIKRMETEGLIQGYGWLYDLKAVGLRWYEIPLSLINMTGQTWRSLYNYCRSNLNIVLFVRSIGKFEIMILFEVKDDAEFDVELTKLFNLYSKNIRDFEIMKVDEIYKFRFLHDPNF
ncbi:AsnC family transcriptional regulator [Candidatus Micrarchaeota archaeon]|nr:AsnC family transcriptional regulator [Candidatus Micrarchaeota archaeon]MBU1681342.1 AsnC family transcriptional regulator [Candidatus Micrarchaeota archaeon]